MYESWMDDALCAQTNPDAFFPVNGRVTADVSAVCAVCPVRAACEACAVRTGQTVGIWAGKPASRLRRDAA